MGDYWADLLRPHGFVAYDFLRPIIWNDGRVNSWYKQNSVGFFRGAIPERVVQRAQDVAIANLSSPQRVVYPGGFALKANNHPWRLARRIVKHVIGRK